jgi:hypothetical protein
MTPKAAQSRKANAAPRKASAAIPECQTARVTAARDLACARDARIEAATGRLIAGRLRGTLMDLLS